MYWPICGISWTFDCTCRANSWSTFSRSARIGSKSCDSAGVDFSTAYQLKTLSRHEEPVKVGRRARRKLPGGHPVHVREGRHHACNVRRLVALPAIRDRG